MLSDPTDHDGKRTLRALTEVILDEESILSTTSGTNEFGKMGITLTLTDDDARPRVSTRLIVT